MPLTKIEEYLRENDISFNKIVHHTTHTAQRTAADVHLTGHEIAKTVIVKMDSKLTMVVLPGDMHVNLEQLRIETKSENIRLASESEFKDSFGNCEVGAMPPFGNLYDMPVYVAKSLTTEVFVAFNACAHDLLIQMKYKDFEALVKPTILEIALKTA
ncbi:aminoacyl-tRNA deacylase [Saccharicrinis aurantiacus]|uniref:aminoacyl-tRNA deacylase n=1 Tax=Saccharicrinis aurantiacus TaxID=1849719 RepID=UPI00094F5EE2|nr:YbaK/EbsC family protein [Saccharicrinis aurantiacus]